MGRRAHRALLLLSLGTGGCDACDIRRPEERALAAYVAAIDPARADVGPAAGLQRLPAHPERHIELPRRTVDIAGFLAIQGCALSERVGQRNSVLGRVMLDSQRWVYEAGFIGDAATCLPLLEDPLRGELRAVMDDKRAELPSVVWNAIWGGTEMPHVLALSGLDLDPGAGGAAQEATAALGLLARHAAEPLAIDSAALESALATLRGSTVGGDVLRALELLRHQLDAAAAGLEGLAAEPPCERLREVFERRYVAEIQPYLARTHRAAEPLLAGAWQLYQQTAGALPRPLPAVDEYARAQLSPDEPNGLWRRYQAAVHRHTTAWQRVGATCGFLPTASP